MYDKEFFQAEAQNSMVAAKKILPGVLSLTGAQSVVDVGCGAGAWLKVAHDLNRSVFGVDGYVEDESLVVSPSTVRRQSLLDGFDCSGYDLAICLETAEHLPERSAAPLVAGLCKAKFVLFSGAIPMQRGVNHINEQWATWWAQQFEVHSFVGWEFVRWAHWYDEEIESFYRQNTILYAPRSNYSFWEGKRKGVTDVVHPWMWTSHKIADGLASAVPSSAWQR